MTTSWKMPSRRARSGRNRPDSRLAPSIPHTMAVSTAAVMRFSSPQELLKYQAMTAPKVTSSPWAKLTSPVVP